jgi:magnesium transporter
MSNLNSRIIEFDIKNRLHRAITIEELQQDGENKNMVYWIHCDLNDRDYLNQLASTICLPDEVRHLCEHEDSMPKLIDTDETITIQIQCLLSNELDSTHSENFGNLIMHLTEKYCFTATHEPLPALVEFEHNYPRSLKYAKTPCFVLFLILDNAINGYAQILFNFELIADTMDLQVRTVHENIYDEVMNVKKHIMKIKRYIVAIREILMRLSGRKITVISNECRASLYNLLNQSQMIFYETDSIRDILNGLLDQIDYVLMQKLNETMRVLTAFAAIFLPLTLITGIYGMNFHWIPELEWKYGYFGALALIAACGIALFFVFRRKKWF